MKNIDDREIKKSNKPIEKVNNDSEIVINSDEDKKQEKKRREERKDILTESSLLEIAYDLAEELIR